MGAPTDIPYKIIDNSASLRSLAKTLEHAKAIGVDLEADSLYHFKEKVCLIQLATGNVNAVIDPLVIEDVSVLKPIFKKRDSQKVFHGSDYDIRSLFRDFRITVDNMFDTELASRFLGFKETSLEAVLKNKFNISLDKKYQRKDWSKRPLPEEMIAYAVKDVGFLVPLAEQLKAELREKGRLYWVYEECKYLSKVRPNAANSNPLYIYFKGAGKLNSRSLAVLEALLQYRRNLAQKKDKPLFRIISSRSLMDLAEKKPVSIKQLEKTNALSPKQIGMFGQGVIDAIARAMKLPSNVLPVYPRKKAPIVSVAVAKRVRALRQWRDTQAKKLTIDPALILTKSLISTLAFQRPLNLRHLSKIKELRRWQVEEFGNDILTLIKSAP
jgi:ribonuclease D